MAAALEQSETTPPATEQKQAARHRGLLLIGLFKVTKSIFSFALGLGAFHLLHKDLGDELMKIAVALRRDPEGRLVTLLTKQVELIDVHHLKLIGMGAFAYSCLALVEGWGLMKEKVWAEYLTVTLTVLFLPWELYELLRRPTLGHWGVLGINLAVLGYLLWILRRKRVSDG